MKLMFPEFKKNIQDHELVHPGDTVILGFSGGKDSVTLAALLQELQKHIPFRLVAAYFNHGLRADAQKEENWVRAFCAARKHRAGDRQPRPAALPRREPPEPGARRLALALRFFRRPGRQNSRRPRGHRPQPLRPERDLLHQALPRQRPAGALGHLPEQGKEDHPPAADLFRRRDPGLPGAQPPGILPGPDQPAGRLPAQPHPPPADARRSRRSSPTIEDRIFKTVLLIQDEFDYFQGQAQADPGQAN